MEHPIDAIRGLLPHRYPFLLIDRFLEIREDRARALKNVTVNEPFFQGHFPKYPIMPGVLILEGMAQTASPLMGKAFDGDHSIPLFLGIERARFRQEVRPGDQLIYELEMNRGRNGICFFAAKALVEGSMVAEAEILLGHREQGEN